MSRVPFSMLGVCGDRGYRPDVMVTSEQAQTKVGLGGNGEEILERELQSPSVALLEQDWDEITARQPQD